MEATTMKTMRFDDEARREAEELVREVTAGTHWSTVGEIADELRTNYAHRSLDLRITTNRALYALTRSIVERLHRRGELERCLGANDGREVRVYRKRPDPACR